MEFRTEAVDDVEYLIGEDGEGLIHQIDLRAIGSWGLLLGLTDTAEIVAAILRNDEKPVGPGEPNMWTPLYETLHEGLDALSASGVPPELMEFLLDPAVDAPVPSIEVCAAIEEARTAGRGKIMEFPEKWGDVSAAVASVLSDREEKIAQDRLAFIDKLAPVYEVPPEPVPEFADVNVPSGVIIPGILAQ
jgi:hypothetical protein